MMRDKVEELQADIEAGVAALIGQPGGVRFRLRGGPRVCRRRGHALRTGAGATSASRPRSWSWPGSWPRDAPTARPPQSWS
jgi:hypothetical protein